MNLAELVPLITSLISSPGQKRQGKHPEYRIIQGLSHKGMDSEN